jgi:CheY-like chemotaxis protein
MRPLLLLVDDCADVQDVLSAALAERGYDIVACGDGRDALDQTERKHLHPAAILLDMRMPIMDGWQFLRARRTVRRLASVPVVVLTSEVRPPGELPAGIAAWLPKTTRLDEIVKTLRTVRDARARVRRHAHQVRNWIVGTLAAVAVAGPGLYFTLARMTARRFDPERTLPQTV